MMPKIFIPLGPPSAQFAKSVSPRILRGMAVTMGR